VARGSALEVQTQLEAACMLKFGAEAELLKALSTAEEVVRILNASIATNKARIAAAKNKQKP
jgi:four helix bundle protein